VQRRYEYARQEKNVGPETSFKVALSDLSPLAGTDSGFDASQFEANMVEMMNNPTKRVDQNDGTVKYVSLLEESNVSFAGQDDYSQGVLVVSEGESSTLLVKKSTVE
jgi:hypothetical protein